MVCICNRNNCSSPYHKCSYSTERREREAEKLVITSPKDHKPFLLTIPFPYWDWWSWKKNRIIAWSNHPSGQVAPFENRIQRVNLLHFYLEIKSSARQRGQRIQVLNHEVVRSASASHPFDHSLYLSNPARRHNETIEREFQSCYFRPLLATLAAIDSSITNFCYKEVEDIWSLRGSWRHSTGQDFY